MAAPLSVDSLIEEAAAFADALSSFQEPTLYGVTDGKAVGTYIEHGFRAYLQRSYAFEMGNSASGIDFPGLGVDLKVTSVKQPQSSCPFKSAQQKVYGLGYDLLVFVYEKTDDPVTQTANLAVQHVIYIDDDHTADYVTSRGVLAVLKNGGNEDDLIAFMHDRNLPIDDIGATALARRILVDPPTQGYLTISNALQWRLQYGRAITSAGTVSGVRKVFQGY